MVPQFTSVATQPVDQHVVTRGIARFTTETNLYLIGGDGKDETGALRPLLLLTLLPPPLVNRRALKSQILFYEKRSKDRDRNLVDALPRGVGGATDQRLAGLKDRG